MSEKDEFVHYCASSLHIDMYAGIEQLEKPLAPGAQPPQEYDQDEVGTLKHTEIFNTLE